MTAGGRPRPVPPDPRSRRSTFDRAASTYHDARPDYPRELLDAVVVGTGADRASRLCEIGPGSGKATLPLAARGLSITAVELGPALAAEAADRLRAFPAVTVVRADFEKWAASTSQRFDVVCAATSWHWLDPDSRCALAARITVPGGRLALWSALHVLPDGGDPFFDQIQEVYEEIGEGLPPDAVRPRPGHLPDSTAEILASGLYGDVAVRHFDWEVTYDAESYLALLDTFSGHIAMRSDQRDRLYGEIRRRLSARPDRRLRRHWGAVLHLARRR